MSADASPLIGLVLAVLLIMLLKGTRLGRGRGRRHWLSAGVTATARGLNDAPKLAALGALLLLTVLGSKPPATQALAITLLIAVAMGLGSYVAGSRVTETLGVKVTRMDDRERFAANLATSTLVEVRRSALHRSHAAPATTHRETDYSRLPVPTGDQNREYGSSRGVGLGVQGVPDRADEAEAMTKERRGARRTAAPRAQCPNRSGRLPPGGPAGAAVELGLYRLGMGTVLTLLALTAALLKQTAMPRVRRLSGLVEPLSAVLLLVTGAYVVFYWLSPGGVLASIEALGGHG